MPEKLVEKEEAVAVVQKTEMADAHCHLDLFHDGEPVRAAIRKGVLTIITNGVNRQTSRLAMEISDHKNIFPAVGIDPEHALKIKDEEIDDEINMMRDWIKRERSKIVAVGEIGLDYTKAKTFEEQAKQRTVFERMIDIANDMVLPMSVHSRNSIEQVIEILKEKKAQKVHLHFFEGGVGIAKEVEKLGYLISIPPLESAKRKAVIRDVAIDHLMAESDSPAVGESPASVELSLRMIAGIKGLTFERTAEQLTLNTKKFFGTHTSTGFMRG